MKKGIFKIILSCFFVCLFLFCLLFIITDSKQTHTIVAPTIENVVNKYDTIDFSKYKGLDIFIREKGYVRDVIIVSSLPNIFDSIIWTRGLYNYKIGGLRIISNDYYDQFDKNITDEELKSLVDKFIDLNLEYLKVDFDNNVFLAPSPFSFEQPFMLRANDSISLTNDSLLQFRNGDGYYTKYKNRWFINNFYIENISRGNVLD